MIDKDFDDKFLMDNSLEGEEWRPVVGWSNYMISNIGRVYSKIRLKPNTKNTTCGGAMCGNTKTKMGYIVAKLRYCGKNKTCKVHRLVAEAFLPKEDGLDIINHKDGDKTNNHVSNIEWCNPLQNNLHALSTGLRVNAHGEKASQCLLDNACVENCPTGAIEIIPLL